MEEVVGSIPIGSTRRRDRVPGRRTSPLMDDPRPNRTSRGGIFVLGLVVGALVGFWLFPFLEQLDSLGGGDGYIPAYDAYVWLAALAVALFVVFRRRG